MVGFNISLAKLDVSVAYAVWSALGTTLVTAVGFFFFGESLDMTKLLYLSMIVSGVVGLNLRGGG
jgi:small multidrug resistance pump